MNGRLILAIISTILEEAALAVIVLVGLPNLGINIPVFVLITMMVVWVVAAVMIYRAGSRALETKMVKGFEDMTGSCGRVVKELKPLGMVRINGELWQAQAQQGGIAEGEEIIVLARKGSRLVVQPAE